MKRATGLGGFFFKATNVPALYDWYRNTLGFKVEQWGASLVWGDSDPNNQHVCYTAWSLFKHDTKHYEPSTLPYMINYRVHDMAALLEDLKKEGINVVAGPDEYDYGKFAWIMDPEGRKIELWEPVDKGFGEAALPWNDKVVAIASVFIKSDDPAKTKAWYKKHLGIEDGFEFRELNSNKIVKLQWTPVGASDKIFKDTDKPYVLGYYVRDLKSIGNDTLSDAEGNKIILKQV